jgi:hypothetical protein
METENTAAEIETAALDRPEAEPTPETGRADFTEEEKTALARYVELTEMAKAERDKCLARHTKGTLCAYIARLRAAKKAK